MSEEIEIKPGELSIATHLPAQWKAEHDETVAEAKAIVTCADDYAARKLGASLKKLKDLKKIVHNERMCITRKLDAFKNDIMRREESICSELTEEETRLSKLGTDYATAKVEAEAAARRAEEEARRLAAEQAAAEAMLTGDNAGIDIPQPKEEEPKKPLVTGVRTHTVVTFSIVDPDAVPRAYCAPDKTAIRSYIQAVKDANPNWDIASFSIPGVEFAKEVRV